MMSTKTEKMLAEFFKHVEDGNLHDALGLYDIILKQDPKNVGALVDKGATLQNMGRVKLAIKSYDRALAISPKNLGALVNKGSAPHSRRRYREAIECHDVALKIGKRCAMILAYKGLPLVDLGSLSDAVRHFKKAPSLDNQYDLAQISMDAAQKLLNSAKEKSKTR